ncbi:App1 family protein [Algoriphagus machipongonensis]|nr:phosphatase domain-containing protein [Algoriphagus machipongonensis]
MSQLLKPQSLKTKPEKVRVEPFLAFGNKETVFVKGRVISSYRERRPSSRNSWIRNIIASIRRYSVFSVANAKVEIMLHEKTFEVETDEDGVFEKQIEVRNPNPGVVEQVNFKVKSPATKNKSVWVAKGVSRFNQKTGVISDIDDTVLISHSTELGKKFWLSISKNAYTRRPLPGVSKFYRALTHNGENPIFYVSSSDWSLYDLIRDFMRFRNIPLGPTLLKDKHINIKNIWKSGGGSHQHKLEKVQRIFDLYPNMKFFLIGDSGQHDPELYAEIIKSNPDRILAVFIRLVGSLEPERKANLEKIIGLNNFFFIESSDEALELASNHKFLEQ